MNQADVLAEAQGRITYLAMESLRGERDAARSECETACNFAVTLECELARYEAALRAARIAVLKIRTVRKDPFAIGGQLQDVADDITAVLE